MKIQRTNPKPIATKKTFNIERHFSAKEVAEHLGVSRTFVNKLCSCGEINASNVAINGYQGKKRHWIIPESELEKFLVQRKVLIKDR
jgi:excisionase family DNA binding protein